MFPGHVRWWFFGWFFSGRSGDSCYVTADFRVSGDDPVIDRQRRLDTSGEPGVSISSFACGKTSNACARPEHNNTRDVVSTSVPCDGRNERLVVAVTDGGTVYSYQFDRSVW